VADDDIDWPWHAFLPGERPLMDGGVIDLGLDLHFTKGRTTMGDRDDGWLPADEKLTPERAARLCRAKNGELENMALRTADNPAILDNSMHMWKLTADLALLFAIVADHIEDLIDKGNLPVDLPLATQQRLENDPHANDHIIELRDDGWMIQHPLSERLDGTLFDCTVTWTEGDLGVYGRYVMVWDEEADEWVLGEKL
jgi:hypothetical protein